MGREFMPELEEGNLWIRAIFPVHVSLDAVADPVRKVREIMGSAAYPEVAGDRGADRPARRRHRSGRLQQRRVLRAAAPRKGLARRRAAQRPAQAAHAPGDHRRPERTSCSQAARHRMGVLAVHPRQRHGGHLRRQGGQLRQDLRARPRHAGGAGREDQGHHRRRSTASHDVGIYRIMGQSNLEFAVDKDKCKRCGVQVADVNTVINSAVHGAAIDADGRGRKDVRHHAALAAASPRGPEVDPGHPGGHPEQQR